MDALLSRVAAHLDKLERREQSLIAKCDLNEGRLGKEDPRSSTSGDTARQGSAKNDVEEGLTTLQQLKAKQLRQKKERLSYAVDRLTLQAQQRERQLRMSMAAPQQIE